MSAVDIIAIRQPDGTIKSTPFCVLFDSKKPSDSIHIEVNGQICNNITMTVHKTGEFYFSPSLARKTSKEQIPNTFALRELDEADLGRQEAEPDIHSKIVEEERLIHLDMVEEQQLLGAKKNGSSDFLRNSSVETLINKSAKVPKNESEGNIHTSPVVQARLISRNGSYGGHPTKDSSTSSERNTTPKTPNRNSSFNTLFFWKQNNNSKKVSPNPSTNGGKQEEKDNKDKDDDIVLTKTPSPEQLDLMNLKDGENSIKFVSSLKQVATAKIYLWNYDVKMIVSDIDGTITKTDKRGLFYYKFGYDWTHDKVVDLYKKVNLQGYQFVYLTARSVKTQIATRAYLEKIQCPNGPILSAPHNLMGCVTTELWKTTAAGKLSHLKPLKELFLGIEGVDPIVAGFGNKVHDHVCYQEVKIPAERIYIINKQSEITVNGTKTTYDSLLQAACDAFPTVASVVSALLSEKS